MYNDPLNRTDPTGSESACAALNTCRVATPAESRAAAGLVADFTPVVGDIKGIAEAINDPTAINITAAVIGVVPGVGDVASKALKTGGNILENAAKGKAGEAITRAKLGDNVAGEQVSFKTSDGTRTRADFVTTDGGVVETKTGGASLSTGQAKFHADVGAGRQVTPVGQNAANAGLKPNEPTTIPSCKVDRPC